MSKIDDLKSLYTEVKDLPQAKLNALILHKLSFLEALGTTNAEMTAQCICLLQKTDLPIDVAVSEQVKKHAELTGVYFAGYLKNLEELLSDLN